MNCIQCGAEMVSTTGGNYYCTKCGASINDLVYRPHNYDVPMPQGFQQQGWICPVCGRGVSPWVDYCPCAVKGDQITYEKTDKTFSLISTDDKQVTITRANSELNQCSTYVKEMIPNDKTTYSQD